jgi:chromosome segregation ATPase
MAKKAKRFVAQSHCSRERALCKIMDKLELTLAEEVGHCIALTAERNSLKKLLEEYDDSLKLEKETRWAFQLDCAKAKSRLLQLKHELAVLRAQNQSLSDANENVDARIDAMKKENQALLQVALMFAVPNALIMNPHEFSTELRQAFEILGTEPEELEELLETTQEQAYAAVVHYVGKKAKKPEA